jgi:hypothetical protein
MERRLLFGLASAAADGDGSPRPRALEFGFACSLKRNHPLDEPGAFHNPDGSSDAGKQVSCRTLLGHSMKTSHGLAVVTVVCALIGAGPAAAVVTLGDSSYDVAFSVNEAGVAGDQPRIWFDVTTVREPEVAMLLAGGPLLAWQVHRHWKQTAAEAVSA